MKIIENENLAARLKIPFKQAEEFGEMVSRTLKEGILKSFMCNENLENFNYSDTISYILKIYSIIFIRGIQLAHDVGKGFTDSENNAEELFEEAIAGLRALVLIQKPNTNEYISGIKKIKAGN